jgi:hypothetical protein
MSSATEGFHISAPRARVNDPRARASHTLRVRGNKYFRVTPWLGTNHQGVGNRHQCLFVKAIAMKFGR